MSKDPFENIEEKEVHPELSKKVLSLSKEKMSPSLLFLSFKYLALFVFSIFFSLMLCPQRGVGVFHNDFLFFHHILHSNEILCGLYCGLFFFLTTHVLTFFILQHFERVKIVKEVSFLPPVLMSSFLGLSMTSFFSDLDISWSYNLSWVFIVGCSYLVMNQFYFRCIHKLS